MRKIAAIWLAGALACSAFAGAQHPDFITSDQRLERGIVLSALWPLAIAYCITSPERIP